ncbi:uncharacterized protein F4812DRAFT_468168 [Daldinia caldariorum]|uniref:uncharacterized protein n=1 Tax=Daldinia caldariorum TaxID=326644 RepID=UPI002008A74A|nr:uncharacterized protein F4812DRAFT_468168 [Daldinia caldariorum]KAI1463980.1 hypothetical protein F4812DRAFT_468168 [Daldinia caldariorum]
MANRNAKQVIKAVNQAVGQKEAMAVRRLRSGAVTVTFRDGATTYKSGNQEWIKKAFGEQATGARRSYTVIVKGPKADKLRDVHSKPQELLNEIRREDSEHIESIIPVHRKLAERAELFQCEPFTKDARSEQCFKCYRFVHTAKFWEEKARCARCAGPARERGEGECTGTIRCRNCGGPHTAWDRACKHLQEAKEKAKEAYIYRPRQFKERSGSSFYPRASRPALDGFKFVAERKYTRSSSNSSGSQPDPDQTGHGTLAIRTSRKDRPRKTVSIAATTKISAISSSLPTIMESTVRAASAPPERTAAQQQQSPPRSTQRRR